MTRSHSCWSPLPLAAPVETGGTAGVSLPLGPAAGTEDTDVGGCTGVAVCLLAAEVR